MLTFGNVNSIQFGASHLLRTLHNEEMRKFRESPRDEREQYAERAALYRDMMDRMSMARTLGYAMSR